MKKIFVLLICVIFFSAACATIPTYYTLPDDQRPTITEQIQVPAAAVNVNVVSPYYPYYLPYYPYYLYYYYPYSYGWYNYYPYTYYPYYGPYSYYGHRGSRYGGYYPNYRSGQQTISKRQLTPSRTNSARGVRTIKKK